MYVHQVHAWCPSKAKEVVGSSGTGVTGAYEPPCEYWELNLVPLQEQPLFSSPEKGKFYSAFSVIIGISVIIY